MSGMSTHHLSFCVPFGRFILHPRPDRIRQLEDALTVLQQTVSHEPHPLLDRELLKIKSSIELHAAPDQSQIKHEEEEGLDESQYIDSTGTLAVHDDGAATFYGRSAGSESLLIVRGLTPCY
jgi:hypothetical protein